MRGPEVAPAAADGTATATAPGASAPVGEALAAAGDAIAAAGAETPRLDAEVMLAAATGLNAAAIAAHPERPLTGPEARAFAAMVRRRVRREPVAYITGTKGFRRIELGVSPGVLIPRPETELLVEIALELQPRRVLDVGTGSGAVALAIAAELPEATVVATDTAPEALRTARENRDVLGLRDRVSFPAGTLPDDGGPFDLLVANLPYVAERDWPGLAPEIREYEPREALVAGPSGLESIAALLAAIAARGEVARAVALEHGEGQAREVAALAAAAGLPSVERRRDLAGVERAVLAR